MSRKAVVLFNIGGPDSLEAVKPFLFNLFNDPEIIGMEGPARYFLAKILSSSREKTARKIYKQIGGKSPILKNTQEQAERLAANLGPEYRIFICMRYWHPRAEEVVKQVGEYDPEEIILLPLYPQYSITTTGSSFKEWKEEAKKRGLEIATREISSYEKEGNFIRAHAVKIRDYYREAEHKGNPRVLFSAHGLPEKIIKKGDPYQRQVEETAQAIVSLLNIEDLDWEVCYQSKVGPLKWIGPTTEEEIIRAAEDGGVSVIIVPISFVSEHSETLVELDMEYRELAERNGLREYFRVPALATDPLFIACLASLCKQGQQQEITTELENTG